MLTPGDRRPAHLQLLAVAWNFGWPVAAGVALGHWLDERFGTSPAASLLLGIGALAAAAGRLVRLSRLEGRSDGPDGAAGDRKPGDPPR